MGGLLLDECVSPRLVPELWGLGVDTVHVRERGLSAKSDLFVWRAAQQEERTIVTANGRDFLRFARTAEDHSGILHLESGLSRTEQLAGVQTALDFIAPTNSGFGRRYLEFRGGKIVCAEVVYSDEKK